MSEAIINDVSKVCAIVPVLNPDNKFVQVVEDLSNAGFGHIIVVNDGSKSECDEYFGIASRIPNCTILKHYANLGKGRALKTAYNHHLINFPDFIGTVAVDADNQHHIDDVVNCSMAIAKYPDSLIMGARDFRLKNVPIRNKTGNLITKWVFNVLCGINTSDTQTGLRAMSNAVMKEFLDLAGERFEYETNMLIETKRKAIPIVDISIRTVYIDDNKSSHFNPLVDSFRIYMLIIKFLSSSLSSGFVDLFLFAVLMTLFAQSHLSAKVAIATVAARICSSLLNYTLNRKIVFKSKRSVTGTLLRYYFLAANQLLISYSAVYLFSLWSGGNSTVIKAIVDMAIAIVGFRIQREWVYRNNRSNFKQKTI